MSEHQPDETQSPGAQPAAAGAQGVSQVRRNLLRAGAIGAPALVALKPAPVIACSCKLPSGFTVSGNQSRGIKNCPDPAARPSIWKGRVTKVKSGSNYYYYYQRPGATRLNIHRDTKVTDLGFAITGYGNSSTTVDQWLNGDQSATGLIIACYLDACYSGNNSNFPAKQKFVDMWNAAVASSAGYAVPNQAKKWDRNQVLGYLLFLTAQAPS